ncbi:unnamed protein product [Pleuronectes platessa]|uniref:Uncharacterized protein n=1 Tax=Pleuronectes platessa TaxID=8262 RepID=A0A9N7V2D4_PLEPL|nr:unnamed protein product [Pleuronectes platessa]
MMRNRCEAVRGGSRAQLSLQTPVMSSPICLPHLPPASYNPGTGVCVDLCASAFRRQFISVSCWRLAERENSTAGGSGFGKKVAAELPLKYLTPELSGFSLSTAHTRPVSGVKKFSSVLQGFMWRSESVLALRPGDLNTFEDKLER